MKKLILLSCLLIYGYSTKAQKLNDSLRTVIKKEQAGFTTKCPDCPSDVVIKYLNFIKAGDFKSANTLISYETCTQGCDMPFSKNTFDEIKANAKKASEISASLSNSEFKKNPVVVYIDKSNAFVYNYIVTGASYPPMLAVKVNGKWKLMPNNKQITNEYFAKLDATLHNQAAEYIRNEIKK